jgi:hypothetical protein
MLGHGRPRQTDAPCLSPSRCFLPLRASPHATRSLALLPPVMRITCAARSSLQSRVACPLSCMPPARSSQGWCWWQLCSRATAGAGAGGARAPPDPTTTTIDRPRPSPTICFKCMFQVFQMFQAFRGMLQLFHMDVAKADMMLHMLQVFQMYVARVCSKYFIYFRRMLQLF